MAPPGNDTAYQPATTEDRPLLFGILHRMDAVENIGSGIRRIRRLCREHGVAEPVFDVSEHWVTTVFPRPTAQGGDRDTVQVGRSSEKGTIPLEDKALRLLADGLEDLTAQVTAQVILFCSEPRTASEIMSILNLKHWKTFQSNYLKPLVHSGWIEMTIPWKPRSSKQKYRLTEKGEAVVGEMKGKAGGSY